MKERVLRRRSWPIFNGIMVVAVCGVSPWAALLNIERRDYLDLWRITAVLCGLAVFFLRMGTCAVVLRANSLLVVNPVGSKEVGYDGIRKVVAGPGAGLEIVTVRDERLVPVVFGGSLVDYWFATSELAAKEIRERIPRRPKPVADAEPVKRTLVRPCRPADVVLVIGVVTAIVGGVTEAIG
ncbi:hypothetical protein ABZ896_42525 [Streptomyces sp. NPDC047072]|uniref:hypothetical protein n=1 Tax=Streptomyces sp. NPDC047072 TaxID=3154809 RepID=UPI0033C0AE19